MTFSEKLTQVIVSVGSAVMASNAGADREAAINFGGGLGANLGRALRGEAPEQAPPLRVVGGTAFDTGGIAGAAGAAVVEESEPEESFGAWFAARRIFEGALDGDPWLAARKILRREELPVTAETRGRRLLAGR